MAFSSQAMGVEKDGDATCTMSRDLIRTISWLKFRVLKQVLLGETLEYTRLVSLNVNADVSEALGATDMQSSGLEETSGPVRGRRLLNRRRSPTKGRIIH